MNATWPPARVRADLLERASRILCDDTLGPADGPFAKAHPGLRMMAEGSLLRSARHLLYEALIEELLSRGMHAMFGEASECDLTLEELCPELKILGPDKSTRLKRSARRAVLKALHTQRRRANDEITSEERKDVPDGE